MKDEKAMAGLIEGARRGTAEVKRCSMCDEGDATRSLITQEFEYGHGEEAVTLHARVPVWTCAACDLQYVDEEGERAQHDAVCRHLNRLTPAQIKAVRTLAGLTQRQFADALNCGIASLKRWETGALIQGRAADALIRDYQTKSRLQHRPRPTFQTRLSEVQRAAAPLFRLRIASPQMPLAA